MSFIICLIPLSQKSCPELSLKLISNTSNEVHVQRYKRPVININDGQIKAALVSLRHSSTDHLPVFVMFVQLT